MAPECALVELLHLCIQPVVLKLSASSLSHILHIQMHEPGSHSYHSGKLTHKVIAELIGKTALILLMLIEIYHLLVIPCPLIIADCYSVIFLCISC